MLVTLDSFEVDAEDIVDLQFLEWYEQNRSMTKQIVKLGYFILKDGLENYRVSEKPAVPLAPPLFEEMLQNVKGLLEQEYNGKTKLATFEVEKKYTDEIIELREKCKTEADMRKRLEDEYCMKAALV